MTTKFTSAQQENVSEPLPLDIDESKTKDDDYRLWIGNMDSHLTEYQLLSILKSCGNIKQFDFLFHKAGPSQGQNRGYSFVSFHSKEDALKAINHLNGKQALSKKLVVKWAHQSSGKKNAVNLNLKSDLVKSDVGSSKPNERLLLIKSIEDKLNNMEQSSTSQPLDGSLHPTLKQSKANQIIAEAQRRTHPYKKSYTRKRR